MAKAAKKPATRDLFDLPAGRSAPGRGEPTRGARPSSAEGNYTAHDIEVLEGLEPVRRRPGMYIGGTDEKALHHIFAEAIDNAMDEVLNSHANFIKVELDRTASSP
jgi:topoisomerase-4 subunit B